MKYYVILVTVLLMALPVNESFAAYISCSSDVSVEDYPICNYVDEWNESEKFNALLVDELSIRVDEINSGDSTFSEVYAESIHKIKRENPGLYEECKEIKNWIYQQLT